MRTARTFIYPLLILFFLSGCATVNNPLTQTRLGALESAYGVVLSAAVAYRNSCARGALPRSCRAITVELQKAGSIAQARVVSLRAFVRQNPTIDATTLLVAAESAVDTFQQVATVYGVR